jgi:hypothetical protein
VRANRLVLVPLVLAAALGRAGGAEGGEIQVGDVVEVISGPAPVKVGDRTLTTVDAGDRLPVVELREDWVKVQIREGGRTIEGWLHSGRVRPISAAPLRPAALPPTDATAGQSAPGDEPGELSQEQIMVRVVGLVVFSVVVAGLLYVAVRSAGKGTQLRRPHREESPPAKQPGPRRGPRR